MSASAFPRLLDAQGLRQVHEYLFVGGVGAFEAPSPWRSHPRGRWLSIAQDSEIPSGLRARRADCSARLGRRSVQLYLPDCTPIRGAVLDLALAFAADDSHAPLLVSCIAGKSRSASVAYGLLRRLYGLDHEEARRLVSTPQGLDCWPHIDSSTFVSVRRWVEGL